MNSLRNAAQAALEALEAMQSYAAAERKGLRICDEAITALRAVLAQEPQTTHSSECWRWHHKCAVAKIERECKHD